MVWMNWRKAEGLPSVGVVDIDEDFILMTPELEKWFLQFKGDKIPPEGSLIESNALLDY